MDLPPLEEALGRIDSLEKGRKVLVSRLHTELVSIFDSQRSLIMKLRSLFEDYARVLGNPARNLLADEIGKVLEAELTRSADPHAMAKAVENCLMNCEYKEKIVRLTKARMATTTGASRDVVEVDPDKLAASQTSRPALTDEEADKANCELLAKAIPGYVDKPMGAAQFLAENEIAAKAKKPGKKQKTKKAKK